MATWREEFTWLADTLHEQWQIFVHGENNQQAVRNAMDGLGEMLARWESAGCPDREEETSV
jgi:hypothetical protein